MIRALLAAAAVVLVATPAAKAADMPALIAPPDAIAGEKDGAVNLVVRLSRVSASQVTVHYATASATARSGTSCYSDYVAASGDLGFAPGETTKTVPVTILDCDDAETLESFTLNLSASVNASVARASTRVSIVDNDTRSASPAIGVRDAAVDEQDGQALVTVALAQASSSTVTVDYATRDGSATSGDYTPRSGTLTFAAGQTAKTIAVPIADDATAEGVERFTLELSNAGNGTILDDAGTVTIGASDAPAVGQPALSAAADVVAGESDAFVDLAVSLSAPGTQPVTVNYATTSSTARSGTSCYSDYVTVSGALTFAPGETAKVVRVEILDCDDPEYLESFTFGLSGPVNATLRRPSQRVGIVDNDIRSTTPRVFTRDVTVDASDDAALVSVWLGAASDSVVGVDYNGGTLTFAPGETAKTITVPVTFGTLTLTGATNAVLSDPVATITVGAHGGPPVAQPALIAGPDITVGEGDSYVDVPVRLSAPATQPVSVAFATASETARSGTSCYSDYVATSGTLTFAPGQTTQVVRLDVMNCDDAENVETFTLKLSDVTGATIARPVQRISIVDNDTLSTTPALSVRDAAVDESDAVALVSVQLGAASLSAVTVDYATHDGSASGADYSGRAGTFTFAPGQTAKTVFVPIADDGAAEPAESFTLTLSGASNAIISDLTATITIGASDQPVVTPTPVRTATPTVTPRPVVTPTPPIVIPKPCCPPPPVPRCVVPRVVGLTLAQAQRKIKAAHCVPGKISRAYSRKIKKNRVISQKRLDLVVSRGERHRAK